MKNLKILLFLLFAITFVLSSCKKKDDTPAPTSNVTDEEAAYLVSSSLSTNNSGVTRQMDDALHLSMAKQPSFDSTFTVTNEEGAIVTFTYTVHYIYGFANPSQFDLNYTTDGSYEGPYTMGSVSSSGGLILTGFLVGDYYVINGSSKRSGTFTTKIGNKTSFTCTMDFTFHDVKYGKDSFLLESGTADVHLTGTCSNDAAIDITGTLVYEGNYSATLTINGKTFHFNLTEGTVTQG